MNTNSVGDYYRGCGVSFICVATNIHAVMTTGLLIHSTFTGATTLARSRIATLRDANQVNPTCTGPPQTVDALPSVPSPCPYTSSPYLPCP
ncbi:hypothetical protein J3R83DRAFT_11182 [Lanmaoa asiatica]|nr:hypothetical protein J3R83DRAFT_11182 [Lanmaoa asiatica]